MKCAKYEEFGRIADVLKLVEEPLPNLKDSEVRLSVLAAPVNPSDYLQVEGRYGVKPQLPAVAGNEGVGRVAEVGKNVTNLKVGDIVILPPGCGTWTTDVTAPAANLFPVQCNNIKQLAMLTVNPPTAIAMLEGVKADSWVIQTAANSAVGLLVIKLANARGIKTVNVVRSEEAAKVVKAKGGNVALVAGDDLSKRIAAATNNAPIALAIDAVGGPQADSLADALAPGGTIMCYGALSGQALHVSPLNLIFRNIQLKGFWLVNWLKKKSLDEISSTTKHLLGLVESGELNTEIDSTFTLDKIHEAIKRAKTGGRNGKVLVLPNGELN